MKYSLTRLLLKTRINDIYWAFFIIMIIFGIYFSFDIYITSGMHTNNPNIKIINVFVIIISIISMAILFLSRISITESDNDLLLEIPLKKIDILKSFYILNLVFISFIIIFLIIIGEFPFHSYNFLISIFDMFLLSLLSINISFIYKYLFKNKIKVILPFIFIIFLILPAFIKFDYSITSIFYGYILNGSVILISLFILSSFYMIKNSNNINLIYKDKDMDKEIKSENIRGSPLKVMYLKNTYLINAIYFFNGFGKMKIYNKRLNIVKILVIMSLLGIIYAIVNIIYHNSFLILFFDFYILVLLPAYYQSFTNKINTSLERLWLSLTSMDNHKYIRNTIFLNALSTFIGFIPVLVAAFIIMLLYLNNVNSVIFIYILVFPYILSVFYLYSSLLISPYQIKYINELQQISMHSGANILRGVIISILFIITLIFTAIAILSPAFIIYLIIYYLILIILSLIMLNSKRLSNYIVKKLINSHFV